MIPGRRLDNCAQSKPRSAITPGRKFSTTTSAVAISRRRAAFPDGRRRLRRTERLFRLKAAKYQLSPSTLAPCPRRGSPPGGSTLSTSAPISANRSEQNGPERMRVRSTTRTPCKCIQFIPYATLQRRGARCLQAHPTARADHHDEASRQRIREKVNIQ